jgi:hypothetical protein
MNMLGQKLIAEIALVVWLGRVMTALLSWRMKFQNISNQAKIQSCV